MALIIGEGHTIQIRSNGTTDGTTIRVRGADGEWVRFDAIVQRVVIDATDQLVRAHLTVLNPDIEIETSDVEISSPEG